MIWLIWFIIINFILILLILVTRTVSNKIIRILELMSDRAFEKYKKRRNKKSNDEYKLFLQISENIYIFVSILYMIITITWISSSDNLFYLISFLIFSLVFAIVSIFMGRFILNVKKDLEKSNENHIGKIEKIIKKLNINGCLYNNIIPLLGRTGKSLLIHMLFLLEAMTFYIVFYDDMSSFFQFVFLMSIPFTLTSWVYLTSFDIAEQSIRRIIVYIVLLFYVLVKSYSDYKILIGLEEPSKVFDFFAYLFLTVFTAFDRLVKSLFEFKDPKKEDVSVTKNNNTDT